MSADNGIFIVQLADPGVFGVVHWTMSAMPSRLPELVKAKRTAYGDELFTFGDVRSARRKALGLRREFTNSKAILEYGIVDWSGTSYDKLMEPYRVEVETEEEMVARFQSLYKGTV